MDNLVNYGSDDDNVDSDNSSKYRQGTLVSSRLAPLHGGGGDYGRVPPSQQRGVGGGGGTSRAGDDGTNYDQIQMDLSEEDEPAKNSSQKAQMSPEMNRDRTNHRPQHRDNNRQRDGRDNKESNSRNVDRDRDREQRDKSHRDDYERANRSNVKDGRDNNRDRSSYRSGRDQQQQQQRNERRNSRDNSKDSGAKKGDRDSRESTRRDNRENNRDSRDGVDNRRDRDRDSSNRRDRDNFNSRERGDRDNYNNRDGRQRENRQRRSPPTNQQNNSNSYRGGAAGRRFDRASNKMAQLEKLGIEIKAPENFVPPASGIYTPDDARGNNGPCHFDNADGGGGGDGQFFMPGVTGKFRDQIERRKQLWAKSKQPDIPAINLTVAPTQRPKPPAPTAVSSITERSTWAATTFAQDTDGRQANKFKRLMGIRGELDGAGQTVEGSTNKRQEEMFSSMEAQYEVARTATHTMRGVGLGFSSSVQGLYQK